MDMGSRRGAGSTLIGRAGGDRLARWSRVWRPCRPWRPAPGKPEPWQIAMQEPVTPIARELHGFHTELMWIITVITLFVLALLVICVVRVQREGQPDPVQDRRTTPRSRSPGRSSRC